MLYPFLAALLIAADQLVKAQVRAHIPLGASLPFLPGFVELTYVRNTGAAFSIFSSHTWLLALISAAVSAAILIILVRGMVSHPFGRVTLAVVLAGAVGNLIDRVLLGYVTDMFNFQFMHFAVFNVADICVVCGGIAFCVYYLFFDKPQSKTDLSHDSDSADR